MKAEFVHRELLNEKKRRSQVLGRGAEEQSGSGSERRGNGPTGDAHDEFTPLEESKGILVAFAKERAEKLNQLCSTLDPCNILRRYCEAHAQVAVGEHWLCFLDPFCPKCGFLRGSPKFSSILLGKTTRAKN